ncbi:MAG TPA: hypothetical protein VNV62_18635 [Trebonia sp.]|jgi:hypothetical protein|nr:hypothetical protein [Trebonia sp.]
MASRAGLSGLALAEIAAGVLLAWSGIENASVTATLRSVTGGKKPAPDTGSEAITTAAAATAAGTGAGTTTGGLFGAITSGASSASAAANQAIARVLAAPYGWSTGTQWADLVSLWNRESGWSSTAENAASGAYGIAQALGHGPTNQYPAGPANPPTSSATAQIAWGLSYIHSTYGSPEAAWAHEESEGWY